jgi:hypothetical protein
MVRSQDGSPAVDIRYEHADGGGWEIQLSAEDARTVGFQIVTAAAAAEADAMLFRFAQENLGAPPKLAAQLLLAFRALRQTPPVEEHEAMTGPMEPIEAEPLVGEAVADHA